MTNSETKTVNNQLINTLITSTLSHPLKLEN